MADLLLGVNIDHIATLRNARGTFIPIRFRLLLLLSKRALTALLYIYVKIAVILRIAMCVFCVRPSRLA